MDEYERIKGYIPVIIILMFLSFLLGVGFMLIAIKI